MWSTPSFTNGDFEANFGGLGYAAFPSLIYTYQLVPRLRGLDITGYNLEITHPANTIGTFGIGDQNASMKWFLPNAEWLFDVGVAGGQTSWGLAFASPQAPHFGPSSVTSGNAVTAVPNVPTPGPVFYEEVPEPVSLLLLSTAGAWMCLRRRRGRPAGMGG